MEPIAPAVVARHVSHGLTMLAGYGVHNAWT